jgi:hypothetical protein
LSSDRIPKENQMRTKDLSNYIDTDAIGSRLERLQSRLSDLSDLVPYRKKSRGYALPTALILGGIAAIGAIAITSIVIREMRGVQYPEQTDYQG